MPTIHLLNKWADQFPQPTEVAPGEWETGNWLVSESRAAALIDHPIHLHRKKVEPAFLSGTIAGYRRISYTSPKSGKTTMRTVFIFLERSVEKAATPTEGWTPAGTKFVT